jgi:hypothetical protein
MWKEATSTRGGRVAIAVAAALAALLVVGAVGFSALAIARAVSDDDHGPRMGQMRGDRDGDKDRRGNRALPWQRGDGNRQQQRANPRDRMPGMGQGDNGLGSLMRSAGALGNVQHGEFTVTGSDGKAKAMTVQRGEVTKASDSSFTVKSEDGFTATYAVTTDTRRLGQRSLETGNQVFVIAEKTGAKAVLVQVRR